MPPVKQSRTESVSAPPRPSPRGGMPPGSCSLAPIRQSPARDIALARTQRSALRAFACACVLVPTLALAQQGARRAEPVQPAVEGRVVDAQISRDSVVKLARAQLGRRYIFGGTTPDGFDCSGFLKYLMRALGVDLPRTAAQQARVGAEVPRDPSLLRPGDILTFGRGNRITHVGVYVGDGKYIHASSGQGRIVESRLDRPQSRLVRAWYGVRRLFTASDSVNTTVAASVKTEKDRS